MTEPAAPIDTEQRRVKPLIVVAAAVLAVILLVVAARVLAAAVVGGPTLNVEPGLPVAAEEQVGGEGDAGLGGEAADVLAIARGETAGEAVDQQRQVLGALGERRHLEVDDPEVEAEA